MTLRRSSRRDFLRNARWAPMAWLPAPFHGSFLTGITLPGLNNSFGAGLAESRFTPHYPSASPLDETLALMVPGTDAYVSEKLSIEISARLEPWRASLLTHSPVTEKLAEILDPIIEVALPSEIQPGAANRISWLDLQRRQAGKSKTTSRSEFLKQVPAYLAPFIRFRTVEFDITQISSSPSPDAAETAIRFVLVGTTADNKLAERTGYWNLFWKKSAETGWAISRWLFLNEIESRTSAPLFSDITSATLGHLPAFQSQLRLGVDHWRTVLDGASGIDVYGNNGIAAGDVDNDGYDDLYVSQPAGLPNRLLRNRGDGVFEDVTEKSGVGVLDATSCAIFADFENRGLQDLLVVCNAGPLLFRNAGDGTFSLRPKAFQFLTAPQGNFTHAAVADYDRDGRLDIYFCVYNYYLGLDQYRYPSPYFDARNGPPNFLLHNEGDGTFTDRTKAAGLDVDNNRYSFACAWGDAGGVGPDIYVANDFGRSNLYRNRGNGTFEAISQPAGVDDPGAGMSACWADFQNSGRQDIYVSNMWSAAGQRVSRQSIFHAKDSAENLAAYGHHARGNSLYRNSGGSKYQNVAAETGTEIGRWAWSADAWDFDHDGYPDLYITNGYISGPDRFDAGSFFWRQVVANSPNDAKPSPAYEHGWNAINEWIRSDGSWSGYERNVLYLNNGDGSFSDVSGISGLDFLDDSRSFALADLDHDGHLEVVLKGRTAPQLRVLRNSMIEIGNAICFRLRGTKSNRDAIGASVTVESADIRQTRFLQAGTGFLSQHSKEVFFGLGKAATALTATVHWPSGASQVFRDLPPNHRISITEGLAQFAAVPFAPTSSAYLHPAPVEPAPQPPTSVQTWLLDPIQLPAVDTAQFRESAARFTSPRLLTFWSRSSTDSLAQLTALSRVRQKLTSAVQLSCICVDSREKLEKEDVRSFLSRHNLALPTLQVDATTAGVFNILYRYLFDRRRDLPLPSSFLVDEAGFIVKVYQGVTDPNHFVVDAQSIPRSQTERVARALPFKGTLHDGSFQRNVFTYGIALFQRGYLDQAAESFKQVIAAKPDNSEAYYNLGTLYLRKNDPEEARRYLQQAVDLRPEYPEAWNNLGMAAAQQNLTSEAVSSFRKSLDLRPTYTTALLNLGNIYRRQGDLSGASELLNQALAQEPENPEVNYAVGMLYARQEDFSRATALLQTAVRVRPDYAEAWNNLGVILIRRSRNSDAEQAFRQCIAVAPNFDQAYLNLAQLYVLSNDKQKAREILQALLRVQPDHKLAQQALRMLN